MSSVRPYVVGVGAISACGVGEAAIAANGASANGRPRTIDDFDPRRHVGIRGLRPVARAGRLACVAAAGALAGADAPRDRTAVVLGTRWGSIDPLYEFEQAAALDGPALVNPSAFPNVVANAHAGYVGILLGLAGPNVTLCGRLAGLAAIGQARDLLERSRADLVLAGGADALGPALVAALGRDPEPRDGEPAGEGAAFLALTSALADGVTPLARLHAFGEAPAGGGPEEAVAVALRAAGVRADELAGTWVAGGPAGAERVGPAAVRIEETNGACQAAGGALAAAAAVYAVAKSGRPALAVACASGEGATAAVFGP